MAEPTKAPPDGGTDMLILTPPRHTLLYRTDAFAKRSANDGICISYVCRAILAAGEELMKQALAGAVAGWMADTTRNELGRIRDMLAKAQAQYFFRTLRG